MIEAQKPIIWMVDEIQAELRTCQALLRRIMPEGMDIRMLLARKYKEDYSDILENPKTATIILDQRLKSTGIATYTGIEIAQYFRGINSKLPIYILTNFADEKDEFKGGEWSVEDIIAKDELKEENARDIVAARIIRHINIYEDIMSERVGRFRALLEKSLDGLLSEEELLELKQLQLVRSSPDLAVELGKIEQLEQIIATHNRLMNRLDNTSTDKES